MGRMVGFLVGDFDFTGAKLEPIVDGRSVGFRVDGNADGGMDGDFEVVGRFEGK